MLEQVIRDTEEISVEDDVEEGQEGEGEEGEGEKGADITIEPGSATAILEGFISR